MFIRHIILREILDEVHVVNFQKNYTLLDNYSIQRKGRKYKYDSRVSETIPVQSSAYLSFIDDNVMKLLMRFSKSKDVFVLAETLRRIILMNSRKRTGIQFDKYSHNVKISNGDLINLSGVNRKSFYKIRQEAIEMLNPVMRDGKPHIDLENLPIIIPDEDGTISLNYMLSPFKNKNEVLVYEEASAMKYYSENGNSLERKLWSKPVMQKIFVNFGAFIDFKPCKDMLFEDFIMYNVYKSIMSNMTSSMSIGFCKFSFDYPLILTQYKLHTGIEKTEREARKVIRSLIDRNILINTGERSGAKKLYVINELLVTL